jgi:triacylglycerol lipase
MNTAANTTPKSGAILFLHGLLGFAELGVPGLPSISYFKGVKAALAPDADAALYFPGLPPVGSIAERAAALACFMEQHVFEPTVHLIGHSMGGLDGRYAIHHLDPQRRIKTLVTLGTPHRGSAIAPWTLRGRGIFPFLAKPWLGDALVDLDPATCAGFNQDIPDRADVRYISYAGLRPVAELAPILRPFGQRLQREEGGNDGLIAVPSAQWGEDRGTLRADHFELVGWSVARAAPEIARPFDHIAFYRALVTELSTASP